MRVSGGMGMWDWMFADRGGFKLAGFLISEIDVGGEFYIPTLRKKREGWGTRRLMAGGGEQATTKADPPLREG